MALVEATRDTNGIWSYDVDCYVVVPGNNDIPANTSAEGNLPGSVSGASIKDAIESTKVVMPDNSSEKPIVYILGGGKSGKGPNGKDYWEGGQDDPNNPNNPGQNTDNPSTPDNPSNPGNQDTSNTGNPGETPAGEDDPGSAGASPSCLAKVQAFKDTAGPDRCRFKLVPIDYELQQGELVVVPTIMIYDSEEAEEMLQHYTELCFRSQVGDCEDPTDVHHSVTWYLCLYAEHRDNDDELMGCEISTIDNASAFFTSTVWWTSAAHCFVDTEGDFNTSMHVLAKNYTYQGIVSDLYSSVDWEPVVDEHGHNLDKMQPAIESNPHARLTAQQIISNAKAELMESLLTGWYGYDWRVNNETRWTSTHPQYPVIPYNRMLVQYSEGGNVNEYHNAWDTSDLEDYYPHLQVTDDDNPVTFPGSGSL